MTIELWIANAAFGVALALCGVVLKMLNARVSSQEKSIVDTYKAISAVDRRIADIESNHAIAHTKLSSFKELFDEKLNPIRDRLNHQDSTIKHLSDQIISLKSTIQNVSTAITMIANHINANHIQVK